MVSATTEQIANAPNISRKTPIPLPPEFGGTGSMQPATGTGSVVLNNSPVLITPALGTPSAVVLTHGTGLVPSSGLAASGTPSSTTFLRGDNSWVIGTSSPVPTSQVLLSGSAATYTTPANVRQLRIRMLGAGGGGAGSGISASGTAGSNGGDTIFNSVHAGGGQAGNETATGSAGGSSSTGTATVRIAGQSGQVFSTLVIDSATTGQAIGANGGGTGNGRGTTTTGTNGVVNTGGGGAGGGLDAQTFAALGGSNLGGAGGSGEYVELVINSPDATYTYTIGASGGAGTAGTSGYAGGTGGTGIIIVDEIY